MIDGAVGAPGGRWPVLDYERWRATCDTLHAHTQVLGKLATTLAPPEPELQHAALRLTARGWETQPLPVPGTSGAVVVALDLHAHATVLEHSDGRCRTVPLIPDRSVGAVTRDVLQLVSELIGPVRFNPTPQETPWSVPLDEDEEHKVYDTGHVADYLTAATCAALVLAEFRAPYRGRSTPVNAWWGSFDLAVSLFSGRPAEVPGSGFIERNAMDAQEVVVGWWPGDGRHPRAAFFAYTHPAPGGYEHGAIQPAAAHWDGELGEFVLDWDDVRTAADPHEDALAFARAAALHGCLGSNWDPVLTRSLNGTPPPVT